MVLPPSRTGKRRQAALNGDAHLKNFSLFASADGDPVFTPAYDLINTTLHLATETPLALDLFVDDFETPAFQTLGFHSGGDFLLLAQRLGLVAARAERLLAQYVDGGIEDAVDHLIARSFLSQEAQAIYRGIVAERRRALAQR